MSVYRKTDDEKDIERLLKKNDCESKENLNIQDLGSKSVKESNVLSIKGNEELKNGNQNKALSFYNESIAKAPIQKYHKLWEFQNSGRDQEINKHEFCTLQYAIENRSALSFKLEKYKLCLKDIDYILQMGCPPELLLKLESRRSKCLEALSTGKEEKISPLKAQTGLENSSTDNSHDEKVKIKKSEIEILVTEVQALTTDRNLSVKEHLESVTSTIFKLLANKKELLNKKLNCIFEGAGNVVTDKKEFLKKHLDDAFTSANNLIAHKQGVLKKDFEIIFDKKKLHTDDEETLKKEAQFIFKKANDFITVMNNSFTQELDTTFRNLNDIVTNENELLKQNLDVIFSELCNLSTQELSVVSLKTDEKFVKQELIHFGDSAIDKNELLEQKLERLFEDKKDDKNKDQNVKSSIENQLPKISYGMNTIIPGFSDCIEIKETEEMDVEFSQHETLTQVMFCSLECRKLSWDSYHHIDCQIMPYYSKTKVDDVMLCILRLVLVAANKHKSLQDFYITVKSYEDNGKEFNANREYDPSDYRTVYFLETNRDERDPDQLERLATQAVKMLSYLETKTSFFNSGDSVKNNSQSEKSIKKGNADSHEENFSLNTLKVFIGGLMLHLQVVPHSVGFYRFYSDLNAVEEVSFGSGMYPLLSLINHSCDPNANLQTFNGNEIVLRAARPIHKGEQIFNSYGADYIHDRDKTMRQYYLNLKYFFSCECSACVMRHLYYDSDDDTIVDLAGDYGWADKCPYFRCQGCGENVDDTQFSGDNEFEGLKVACTYCKEENNIEKLENDVWEALEMLQNFTENTSGNDKMDTDLIFKCVTTVNNTLERSSIYHIKCDQVMCSYFQREAYNAGYSTCYSYDFSQDKLDPCNIS